MTQRVFDCVESCFVIDRQPLLGSATAVLRAHRRSMFNGDDLRAVCTVEVCVANARGRLSGLGVTDENADFEDTSDDPISNSFVIVDPLMSPGSSWQRGLPEVSRYAKARSIVQMEPWTSDSPVREVFF